MIQSRLDEIDAATAPIVAAIQRAATMDLGDLLRAEHAELLERTVAAPLREAISQAIEQLGLLDRLIDGQQLDGGAWDGLCELQDGAISQPIGQLLTDDLWLQVTDVCFAARGELRRADRALRQVEPRHEDRLATCEAALRKLRRALAAVLAAIGRARNQAFPVLATLGAEVDAAIAVRRMYTKFRRSLPSCVPTDPSSVRRALRYSAVSLAVMIGGSDFGDARTQDRALILQLQSRILRWARDGASDADGVQLYQDIVTAADLLRAINLRQELATNDQRLLAEASAALDGATPAAAIAAALPALHALAGRDDALDAVVAVALSEPPTPVVVAALRAALAPASGAGYPGADDDRPE